MGEQHSEVPRRITDTDMERFSTARVPEPCVRPLNPGTSHSHRNGHANPTLGNSGSRAHVRLDVET